jgi:hypothetical protein
MTEEFSMKPTSYCTQKPSKGICKQSAIWVTEGGRTAPLIYLQRPKWIKDDDVWEKIVESVSIDLPMMEIK